MLTTCQAWEINQDEVFYYKGELFVRTNSDLDFIKVNCIGRILSGEMHFLKNYFSTEFNPEAVVYRWAENFLQELQNEVNYHCSNH